jgi:hypothetical protein
VTLTGSGVLSARRRARAYDRPMPDELAVLDGGRLLRFTFEDLMAYHGGGSPGGVAHAFKVMQRAWPLLDADATPDRLAIAVRTAFGGPGARDGFELVTRAVTGGRYALDPSLARPERGRAMERFVFRLHRGAVAVTLAVRPGFVEDELIDLVRRERRTAAEDERLETVKAEMAERVMAVPAEDVYDATTTGAGGIVA